MTDLRSPKVPTWLRIYNILVVVAALLGALYTAAKGQVAMTVFLSAWWLVLTLSNAVETAAGDIIRAMRGDR